MARDVFISYRSEDKVWADRLCEGLERQNITCWIAPRDIVAGREWAEAIVDALQHSKSFVLVLSSHSSNARQISREAELADHQGLPMITFRVENVQPPPGLLYFLGNVQWLDAFDDQFDAALARLTAVVRGAESRPPAAQPFLPPSAAAPAPRASSRNLAIGTSGLVVLALGAWFLFGRTKPNSSPANAGAARTETETFLNALKVSNFDEAWSQFTPEARAGHPKARMVRTWSEAEKKFGPIQSYRINRCTQNDPAGVFTCGSTLEYRGGLKAEGRYVVSHSSESTWGIADSTHSEPK